MVMAYYVLLDNTYTSIGHAGTSADPWSFEQLYNLFQVSSVSETTFKLRGERTDGSSLFVAVSGMNNIYENWDVITYGPWKMRIQYCNYSDFKDGIISHERNTSIYQNSQLAWRSLDNCYVLFKGVGDAKNLSANAYVKDSVIHAISGSISFEYYPLGNFSVTNSILYGGHFDIDTVQVSFNNVMTNKTSAEFINTVGSPTYINNNIICNSPLPKYQPSITDDIGIFDTYLGIGPTWAKYPYGLWGSERYSVGSFYFDPIYTSGVGHIGAFYFGPIGGLVDRIEPVVIDVSVLDPTLQIQVASSATLVLPTYQLVISVNNPIIYSFRDIIVDFVGKPVKGSSPLCVEYTAYVTFGGTLAGRLKVKEYRWYFDYVGNPSVYVSTDKPVIRHSYVGAKGKTYSVRLCVVVEPK